MAHTFTPAYNPQSNNVERFHRTLRDHYRMWIATRDEDWVKQLPCLELAYNSKVNEATGLTPFLVFLGREAKMPADLVLPNHREVARNPGAYVAYTLDQMNKIYEFLKTKEKVRIHWNSMRYSNLPALRRGDTVWYLSSRNVVGMPVKITKSWTGPWEVVERVAAVLYRIKPHDTSSIHPAITAHIGRLKKFTLDHTERFMPPGLRTDPDEELEEMTIPHDPKMKVASPPPQPAYVATPQLRARRFIKPPGGRPALPGEKRNQPPREVSRPRGTRISGQPLRGPGPQEDMEEENPLEPPMPPKPVPEEWPGEEDMDMDLDLGAGGEVEPTPPDQHKDQVMEDPMAELPAEEADTSKARARSRPTTRSQTKANQRRVTFQSGPSFDQYYESACIRLPDGTIDMEPANLARMCKIETRGEVTLPPE